MSDHRLAVEHGFIRNPENPYTGAQDCPITRLVVLPLFFVHTTVDFDRKLSGIAVEVYDKSFNYLLTPEVESVERVSPKGLPENSLGRGHFAAQLFGERQLAGLNTLDASYFTAMCHWLSPMPKNLTPNPFPRGKGNRIKINPFPRRP